MSLVLHAHPLSSYCWKVLVGLYENGAPFEMNVIDFGDEASRDAFYALAPLGKMPVLEDRSRGEVVAESSTIFDYLDLFYPGAARFVPEDPDQAWRVRQWDRVIDLHLHEQMQRIVDERLRGPGDKDPFGLARAQRRLKTGCDVLEMGLAGDGDWLCGGDFGLADCAAFPALFYAEKVTPLGSGYPRISAYLARLTARPSVQRVLAEAEPYFKMFPQE